MRGAQDLFACTVLCARQRRVKLTLELSFLRRASRWSAPSAKRRRRASGTPTGTIRTIRSVRFATTDRYVTRVDPTPQYFIIFVSSHPDPNTRGALFRSSLPAVASAPVAVRMGQIQAKCEGRSSRKTRGTACRVAIKRCAFHDSPFFLSLCSSDPVGMITSVTSCFVSTHVVRVPYSSQELAIETAAGTTCVECGTDTTSMWLNCKDNPGTKMCKPCFNKNQLDVAAAAGTTCVKCGTDTTSQWQNCKDKPGTKLCRSCHNKNQLDDAAAAGTTCVKCGTDTTIVWYSYKDKPGTKFCVSCYRKNQLDFAAAAGTTCVKCGTDATSGQWYVQLQRRARN